MINSNPLALIIEDNETLATIFSIALQTANYSTEIISDGQTAVNKLSTLTPAIVLLDLHLPHVSGEALLHQIKTDKRLKETRVMVTTADAVLAEKLRSEADLVLLKPISVNQLQSLSKRLRPPEIAS